MKCFLSVTMPNIKPTKPIKPQPRLRPEHVARVKETPMEITQRLEDGIVTADGKFHRFYPARAEHDAPTLALDMESDNPALDEQWYNDLTERMEKVALRIDKNLQESLAVEVVGYHENAVNNFFTWEEYVQLSKSRQRKSYEMMIRIIQSQDKRLLGQQTMINSLGTANGALCKAVDNQDLIIKRTVDEKNWLDGRVSNLSSKLLSIKNAMLKKDEELEALKATLETTQTELLAINGQLLKAQLCALKPAVSTITTAEARVVKPVRPSSDGSGETPDATMADEPMAQELPLPTSPVSATPKKRLLLRRKPLARTQPAQVSTPLRPLKASFDDEPARKKLSADSGAGEDEDSFFKIKNISGISDMLDVHASADAD